MHFGETRIAGALTIDPEPLTDERGFFARTFCAARFAQHGLVDQFPQCSLSYNRRRGVLRGLHWQAPPAAEVKLVRCASGAVFDVLVDLRADSATFRQWEAFILSAANRRSLYIPEGVAHGFQALEDHAEVFYQISTEHRPNLARGLAFDDPALAIPWPVAERTVSPRDQAWPTLEEAFAC